MIAQEDALREAAAFSWDWPVSADGWINTMPTHDPEGLLPKLAALAAGPDPARWAVRTRHAFASMHEDIGKIRNFVIAGEDRMVRFMCPSFATYGVARLLAFLNHQYFNGIRNLLTKPKEFSILPAHFWEDFPRLLATEGPTEDLRARAERLYEECRELFFASGLSLPEGLSLEDALERGRAPGRST